MDKQRVRVNVRLADARNAQTLWSEQYDRELQDIFALQSEIALHIAAALGATLSVTSGCGSKSRPRKILRPIRLYSDSFRLAGNDVEQVRKGIEMFREAIRLDPGFALARDLAGYPASDSA